MVKWFWQRPQVARVLALRSRDAASGATKVEFAQLAPSIEIFLGQAGCEVLLAEEARKNGRGGLALKALGQCVSCLRS